jgi:purine-nucleoside phosphorylase
MLLLAAAREELGELEGEVVGVGPVVAAARAAAILAKSRPEFVVMLGTGGAYTGGPPIGSAIASAKVGLSYGVAAMGLGYVPRAPSPVLSDEGLLRRLDLPQHNVLTTGAITTDLTLAERIADGFTVEHLEAFGVAIACQQAGIPFVAVLGISNEVGPDAHTQWLTHRDAAHQAARRAIRPLLESKS